MKFEIEIMSNKTSLFKSIVLQNSANDNMEESGTGLFARFKSEESLSKEKNFEIMNNDFSKGDFYELLYNDITDSLKNNGEMTINVIINDNNFKNLKIISCNYNLEYFKKGLAERLSFVIDRSE